MKNDMQGKTNPNGALPLQQKYCFEKIFSVEARFSKSKPPWGDRTGPEAGPKAPLLLEPFHYKSMLLNYLTKLIGPLTIEAEARDWWVRGKGLESETSAKECHRVFHTPITRLLWQPV
jgi:hypothetical protein